MSQSGAGRGVPGQLGKSSRYFEWEGDFSSRRPMLPGDKGAFYRQAVMGELTGALDDFLLDKVQSMVVDRPAQGVREA